MARKYIKFSDGSFLIFSDALQHSDMAATPELTAAPNYAPDPVSAGFIMTVKDAAPMCFGESIGLGLEAAPTDTEELRAWLRG